MSGPIWTVMSLDSVVPAPAAGGSRHRGAERWGPAGSPPGSHQRQHRPRLARASPLLPQSPPPTLFLPLLLSPEPRQTPLRPRPAPVPRLPQPRRRPRCALPGGYGGAPRLPTLRLGASASPAAPRRLPAPPGTQRFRAPRARIPAGGSGCGVLGAGAEGGARAYGSQGRKGLGDRFLCSPEVGAEPGLWGT